LSAEQPTDVVRGFISTAHGEDYDFRPRTKKAGDKDVYEVHISQKWTDRDADESGYHNIRVSVWGKAIAPVKAIVERILAKPKDDRPQIAFEGEWQDAFHADSGKVTHQFRAYDASPWFTAYPKRQSN
jgi:hypothetical protein